MQQQHYNLKNTIHVPSKKNIRNLYIQNVRIPKIIPLRRLKNSC